MRYFAALVLTFFFSLSHAADTPAGLWRIDDDKGKPDALVRIFEKGGVFYGRFEKLFNPDPAGDRCTACRDERKDQPLIGMIFLSDFKRDGDRYNGRVLDPESGNSYRCMLRVVENGQKLEVRGYIGVSLFGRTQTWHRAKE